MASEHFGKHLNCHKITVEWEERVMYNFCVEGFIPKCTKEQRAGEWVDGDTGCLGEKVLPSISSGPNGLS